VAIAAPANARLTNSRRVTLRDMRRILDRRGKENNEKPAPHG
jgi:hypothetical protein